MPRHYTFSELALIPGFPFHLENSVFPESFVDSHTHEFAELVIVRHGHAVHVWEGRRYPISAGSVFVIGPEQAHQYEELRGLDLCNLGYDPSRFLQPPGDLAQIPGFHALFHLEPFFRREQREMGRLELDARGMRELYTLIEPIEEEYQSRRPGCQAMIQALFTVLAGHLSRAYTQQAGADNSVVAGIARAVTYAQVHFNEGIRLDDLAREAGMARTTFVRAFRSCYGLSPMQYVLRFRLEKSRELLTHHRNLSVTEAGLGSGFSDGNYFIRMFTRAYGEPPGAWRMRHHDPLGHG